MKVAGEWSTSKDNIKSEFYTYYKSLFEGDTEQDNSFEDTSICSSWLQELPFLDESHKTLLLRPFSDDEIKVAAFSSNPLKSSGPDGVPLFFF